MSVTLLIVIIFAVILIFYSLFFKDKDGLLTKKIKEEIKKSCPGYESFKLSNWVEQLYYPSWISVIVVFICASVIFVATRFAPAFSTKALSFDTSSHFQNLIAILAGIGTIIFALIIFIAESLRDDETKDRARVLLRESFLFPLTVAEILSFFIFIWGDVNIWSILSIIAVAILTIASLWRLLSVLLSNAKFSAKRLKMLKDGIGRSIGLAIRERFGNGILLQSLGENKTELSYYPLSLDEDDQVRQLFYSEKNGVVVDIRLDKLDEFAKLLESEANRNGFSFYKDKVKKTDERASDRTVVGQANIETLKCVTQQYLHKKYRDEVEEDNNLLLSIDKKVIKDELILSELEGLSKEIFIIKPSDNFSEEIKSEITGLRDQFIVAITDKKTGKIEDLINVYINLAEAFLAEIKKCDGCYSYDQAIKERSAMFGGWNEVKWLSESIHETYVKAIQSKDHEIISRVAYLPVAIAIRAISAGDQYLYQEFLSFPQLLYRLAVNEEPGELRKFMIDRSWRHIKEMSDFFIEYKLKRRISDPEKIKKYKEFTTPIFTAFQNFIKTSFDKRDFDSFGIFLDKFSEMYMDFNPEHEHPDVRFLENNLKLTQDPKQQEEMNRLIVVKKAQVEAAKGIKLNKQQVIFGLSAYILEQLRRNNGDADIGKFYEKISSQLPNQLPELTSVYQSSRGFDIQDFWRWDDWETIADGRVHTIDFHSKLDRLFCIQALVLLLRMNDEAIKNTVLPNSRDLAFLADDRPGNPNLISMLNNIAENKDKWPFAVSVTAIDKIDSLKKLLTTAKTRQEQEEEKFLETVQIDPEKLEKFKANFKKSFEYDCRLRPVIMHMEAYKDLTKETPEEKIPSWGYNQIDEKAAFIKDWYVHYGDWGQQYGQGMANSDDEIIYKEILSGVSVNKNISKQDLIQEIEKLIIEKNIENPVVLQSLDYLFEYEQIKGSELFVNKYDRDCPKTRLSDSNSFMGVLKLGNKIVSVVDVFAREDEHKNKVVVADLNKFCILKQYSPVDKADDEVYKEGMFFLHVADLNLADDIRNKIITENPVWLQAHENGEAYLRRHVLINVYQKFKIDIIDPNMGFCFDIKEEAAADNKK